MFPGGQVKEKTKQAKAKNPVEKNPGFLLEKKSLSKKPDPTKKIHSNMRQAFPLLCSYLTLYGLFVGSVKTRGKRKNPPRNESKRVAD